MAAAERAAAAAASRLAACLAALRTDLASALEQAGGGPAAESGLPAPRGMPVLGAAEIARQAALPRPRLAAALGRSLLRAWSLAELRRRAGPVLTAALGLHHRLLVRWSEATLAELRTAFEASAEPLRIRIAAGAARDPAARDGIATAIALLGG